MEQQIEKQNLDANDSQAAVSNIDFSNFEERLDKIKRVNDLFSLYSPSLDGSNAEGYSYALYSFFETDGAEQFISSLSKINDPTNISGIVFFLTCEIELEYENDDTFDMNAISDQLNHLLAQKELSSREKQIIYQILADIEQMKC